MTSYGPLLQFALLSGFVLAVTLTLLIGAFERPLRRALWGKAPSQRARVSWWMLVTPALAGIAYTALTIAMPSMFDSSARFAATCSAHADALLHLCVWHPSGNGQSAWLWGALALLAGYAAWLASRAAVGLWRARRTLASMVRLSWRPGHPDKLRVLDVDQPMALACGVGNGHILLSTSLMRRLDPTQLRVVLAQHGYLSKEDWPELEANLCELNPDLVLVALGVPRQELWTQRLNAIQTGVWMGVGGSFDVWAGLKERAPKWTSRFQLEWLYRLLQDPSRWRRYLALPKFVWAVLLSESQRKPAKQKQATGRTTE